MLSKIAINFVDKFCPVYYVVWRFGSCQCMPGKKGIENENHGLQSCTNANVSYFHYLPSHLVVLFIFKGG